jgi:hypothetical protein
LWKYEIIFHNFVCRSFCRSFPTPAPVPAPAKYAGAPGPAPAQRLRRPALATPHPHLVRLWALMLHTPPKNQDRSFHIVEDDLITTATTARKPGSI